MVWTDLRHLGQSSASDSEIFTSFSDDAGESFSAPINLSDDEVTKRARPYRYTG